MGIEVEASLAIIDQDPQGFIDKFATITNLGEYEVTDGEVFYIHDIYWDTPDCALKEASCGIRLRKIGDTQFITFKGKSSEISETALTRFELEDVFNEAVVYKIAKELTARGIRFRQPTWQYQEQDPFSLMQEMGFEIIQERMSYRQLYYLIKDQVEYAEIAIDRVTFQIRAQPLVHYELEIELLYKDQKKAQEANTGNFNSEAQSVALLNYFIEQLKQIFPNSFTSWNYSKLATGRTLEELLETHVIKDLVNEKSVLTSQAYKLIENYLKS